METEDPKTRAVPDRKNRIPRLKSVEEAAEFWDAHDSAEFEDEFEAVEDVKFVVLRGKPEKAVTVHLPTLAFAALRRQAEELGLARSALVRLWILERLRELQGAPARKSHGRRRQHQ